MNPTHALIALLALAPLTSHAIEGCALYAPAVVDMPHADLNQLSPTSYLLVEVECEAGLAYELELTNAKAGGWVEVQSHQPETIPMFFVQANSRTPWGRADQGEAIRGVGTGSRVSHPLEAGVHLSHLPAPGAYRAPLEINLIF